MHFGYAVFERSALNLIFHLAIPQSAFKGNELPLLESVGLNLGIFFCGPLRTLKPIRSTSRNPDKDRKSYDTIRQNQFQSRRPRSALSALLATTKHFGASTSNGLAVFIASSLPSRRRSAACAPSCRNRDSDITMPTFARLKVLIWMLSTDRQSNL
jgi:hypothetical protein